MRTVACLIVPFVLSFSLAWAEPPVNGRERVVREPVFGGSVYLYEAGRPGGKSIILVSGVGNEGLETWAGLIPVLAESYHVMAFDLPGFGLSDRKNVLYSPENYARFLKWIVDEYAPGPVCVVGHSLGGAVSLYYAGTYPEGLERLVLVDVAGVLHRVPYAAALLQNKVNDRHGSSSGKGFLGFWVSFARKLIEEVDLAFMPDRLSGFLKNSLFRKTVLGGHPGAISGMALIDTDFSRVIGRVKVPVSILWGDRDPVAPVRTGKLLAASIPGARMHVLRDVGHSPMLERPEAFGKLLFPFLEGEPVREERPCAESHNRGIVRVSGRRDLLLTGAYDRIDIVDCQAIRLLDVAARQINIEGSSVGIEGSVIVSDGVGIRSIDSTLTVTGTTVRADVAILAGNSRIDLAGVRLEGTRASIDSIRENTVVFSVCRTISPHSDRYIHDILKVDRDHPI